MANILGSVAGEHQEPTPVTNSTESERNQPEPIAGTSAADTDFQPKVEEKDAPLTTNTSKATNEVFIQQTKGFLRTNPKRFEKMLKSGKYNGQEPVAFELADTAIAVQTMFHNLSLICEGFVSGVAAAHAVFALCLNCQQLQEMNYARLSMPIHAAFFVVLVIVSVSALDRFETGGTVLEILKRGVFLHGSGLGALFWIAATLISIATIRHDEVLASSDSNTYEALSKIGTLNLWRWLCFARAASAFLGWLMTALSPNSDYLRQQLQKMATENERE